MRILLADKDMEHRLQVQGDLQNLNCQVIEVAHASEVLNHAKNNCPDLFILDAATIEIETIRQLRSLGNEAVWNGILILEHNPTEEKQLQAALAGADDLLAKPVNYGQLALKVGALARHLHIKDHVISTRVAAKPSKRVFEAVSIKDNLTGLANINQFEDSLESLWFQCRKEKVALSLIYWNLDYFRAYNNQYGAVAGDAALKSVAKSIQATLPQDAVLARTLEATFVALLPQIDEAQGMVLAQAARQAVADLQLAHASSGASHVLTASAGVSTVAPPHYTQPWDLTDSADFALYQAKHAGFNQARFVLAQAPSKA